MNVSIDCPVVDLFFRKKKLITVITVLICLGSLFLCRRNFSFLGGGLCLFGHVILLRIVDVLSCSHLTQDVSNGEWDARCVVEGGSDVSLSRAGSELESNPTGILLEFR